MIDGLVRWYRHQRPDAIDVAVSATSPPGRGYSGELLFAAVVVDGGREDVVVRMDPAGPPLFPDGDLRRQLVVQQAVGGGGIPVAGPIVHEPDPAWVGRPFLLMPQVAGRHPGDAPALTPWVTALPPADRRRLHAAFLDVLADIHALPVAGGPLPEVLRDGTDLAGEVGWWERFAEWACEGVSPAALLELLAWCRDRLPPAQATPPPSVLWGDVRLGNVVVGDDLRPAAILDWEMATIGPAESDLAWLTTLDAMTEHFVGTRVDGFLARDEVIEHHERRLRRPLRDFAWHEAFALARAAAASVRTAVVAALAAGAPPPDPAAHAVVRYATRRITGTTPPR